MRTGRLIIISICFYIFGCINIAPNETWDQEDTVIWLEYGSSLHLDPGWFDTEKNTKEKTILKYKEEFEGSIIAQIRSSPYFDEIKAFKPDSDVWVRIKREGIIGVWHTTEYGYKFIQTDDNQYPMDINIYTESNKIIIDSR